MKARIGVDATCWGSRRGYGRFLRSLLEATLSVDHENEYVFFVDSDSQEFPLPERRVKVIRASSRVPTAKAAGADGRRALRDVWNLSRTIAAQKLDLFFFPSVYSYIPLASTMPKIVTVHDVIPELFPKLVFPTLRSKFYWRAKVKMACAQARLILTVSEYSRRCLSEHLGLDPSRLRVVNEASDPVFRKLECPNGSVLLPRLRLRQDARFVIYVGGFSPHKNLNLLVDAFGDLRSRPGFDDVFLLLVGDYQTDVFHSCYREIDQQVRQMGLQDRVLFPGYIEDSDLVTLFNIAQVLVLPSFCEGFGLPAVEAAACGAPVIVTTESPLPGLLKGGAISVEPSDRDGLLAALTNILNDPARQKAMGQAALMAARELSWESSAQQLLAVFGEALASRGKTA